MPDVEGLTKQAAQRLEAIQQMEELGSGFYLAMHDLEIRGAGEVLGENQSGNMLEVGFQLYNDMLAEAVRSLKAGREPDLLAPLSATTEINLHAPALLPDAYCGDVHIAPVALQAAGHARTNAEQIDALLEEIIDRFGKLPPQGADAVRRAPPARARQALRRRQDRRGAELIDDHLQAEPADRCDAHHRAGAEEPPHQARRQRQAAHRARRCRSRRTARRWCATCCARSARRSRARSAA